MVGLNDFHYLFMYREKKEEENHDFLPQRLKTERFVLNVASIVSYLAAISLWCLCRLSAPA